jgi:hypothetical protein
MGAARCAPLQASESSAFAFDFGGSFVKRAIARYQGRHLIRLELLPTLPAECAKTHSAQARAHWMLDLIATTVTATQATDDPLLVQCSVASYVQGGQPADRGCWLSLNSRARRFLMLGWHHACTAQ